MADVEFEVNAEAVRELGANIDKARKRMLVDLSERGYELLKAEVPVRSGTLKKGVRDPIYDFEAMTAEIVVSAARDAQAPGVGEVFDSKGKPVKTVTLRPSPAFNYALPVARGRAAIAPKHGKALLIPVNAVPSGEGYLLAGGQIYVFRRSAAAFAGDPFDERAAARLQSESTAIGEAVLRKYFVR